jgi:Ni,Fe-hydrogenase maturation factor
MAALRLMDREPGETVLLGIQPESTEWSATLTRDVEAALPQFVDAAIDVLDGWSGITHCVDNSCITA